MMEEYKVCQIYQKPISLNFVMYLSPMTLIGREDRNIFWHNECFPQELMNEDAVLITGSPDFAESVIKRLHDLVNHENMLVFISNDLRKTYRYQNEG